MSEDDPDKPSPAPLEYFTPGRSSSKLVTVRRLGSMEAELAKLKLESEGVRCFIGGQNTASIYPLLFTDVDLQVAESDLAEANEILSIPRAEDEEGEYVEEAFRCPKCHRKSVQLMPLSNLQILVRTGLIFGLVIPFLFPLIKTIFPNRDLAAFLNRAADWGMTAWAVTLVILVVVILFSKRGKHCTECGHFWR
jgi:hypothetical protein